MIASLCATLLAVLAGCSPSEPAELARLRERFVEAGGTCSSWTVMNEPRSLGAIQCAEGAKLYLFDSDTSRSDVVKTELETNRDIRDRTHIMLSGDYWLIIDRIPVIIHSMAKLGGIIQGRNGANP